LLELIADNDYIGNAARVGKWFLGELEGLAHKHSGALSNVRGRGLFIAFDLTDGALRDDVLTRLRVDEHVLALASGERAIRFRPALSVTEDELGVALAALERVLSR
ncbi:MAG: aminotransferase class III-fold pyridoxal phosphate-dependent enzyme, partial [Acidimicrobiales bacterium]